MQDYSRSVLEFEERTDLEAVWTIRERTAHCLCGFCRYGREHGPEDPVIAAALRIHGVWTPVYRTKNLFTNYGLTQLASAIGGIYTPPIYLAIESTYTTPAVQVNVGDPSVQLTARVDQPGDTQIILGVGTANQETVTFTGVTGAGPYVYTLSGTAAQPHLTTDPVCRAPAVSDTMTNVTGELQYDSTNFPNQRMQSPGGYSNGTGNFTIQFYYPGPVAQGFIALAGLTDNVTIGQGNLHNHFALGYNHNNVNNDLEIDGSLTLINA